MDYNEKLRLAKEALDSGSYDKETIEYIFPELKESEEEKIRKILIHIVKGACDKYGIKYQGKEISEEKLIAWIEAQGEHANFRNKIQIGDKVTRNEDGVLVNLSQFKRIAKKDEKKGEQNIKMIQWKGDNLREVVEFTGKSPKFDEWFKNWEEYEEYVLKHGNILKLFDEDGSHYEIPVGAWIVKTPDGYNVPSVFTFKQKDTEWSEDDEKHYQGCLNVMNIVLNAKPYPYYNDYLWLKSLKDRIQPQPNQEWSEEDNIALKVITQVFEVNGVKLLHYPAFIHWLKTLPDRITPRNTWKPSDEQLTELRQIVNQNKDNMLGRRLESLYDDLRKL